MTQAIPLEERRLPSAAMTIFALVGLFIVSDSFRDVLNPVWQPIRMLFYAVTLLVAARDWKVFIGRLRNNPFLLLLTLLAVFSIAWSTSTAETISRSFGLMMTTLFALCIATRFTIRQQVHLLALYMGLSVLFSLAFVFGLPQYGRAGAAWEGIYTQKNVFGRVMALGMLVILVFPVQAWRGRLFKLLAYVMFIGLVLAAQSATSLVISLVITVLFFAFRIFRFGFVPGVAFAFATAIPLILMAQFVLSVDSGDVLESLGRDRTLTGRTGVWEKLDIAIAERPLTGYGYGAFWNNWNGMFGRLWSRWDGRWVPGSAHNTYLDLHVNIGLFGVIFFVMSSALFAWQALKLVRGTRTTEAFWPLLYISFLLILGYSEDFALYLNIFWTLYIVAAYSMLPALKRERQMQRQNISVTLPKSERAWSPAG